MIWALIGLVSGVQIYFVNLGTDTPLALHATILNQVLSALPWIPATPLIIWLARRFSPAAHHRRAAILIHLMAGSLCVLVINIVQTLLHRIAGCPIGCPQTFADDFGSGVLQWGHFALLVYATIVIITLWLHAQASKKTKTSTELDTDPVDLQGAYLTSLIVWTGRTRRVISVPEVDWIEASGDYVCLHVGERKHFLGARLYFLEQKLDPDHFARIHRSIMVNLKRVREFSPISHGDYLLILDDGTRLKLTRSRRAKVLERLQSI